MREIKFRAQRRDNKQWVYGYYYRASGLDYIVTNYSDHEIFDNTLGQLTGLKDKNGSDIYEGDILEKKYAEYGSEEHEKWCEKFLIDEKLEGEPLITKRDFCTMECFRYWLSKESFGWEGEGLESSDDWVVIGNIYDNKELLN